MPLSEVAASPEGWSMRVTRERTEETFNREKSMGFCRPMVSDVLELMRKEIAHPISADALDEFGHEQVSLGRLLAFGSPVCRRVPQQEQTEMAQQVSQAGAAEFARSCARFERRSACRSTIISLIQKPTFRTVPNQHECDV